MISSIVWVPAGVADPNPKKYEFSTAELELIKMMEEQDIGAEGPVESDEEVEVKKTKPKQTSTVKLPKIENNLPADLRMDEYSSDEDENDAVQGTTIGQLLVEGSDAEADMEDYENMHGDDDDDNSDSEDDLEDVPDTREYMPLDVEGYAALGISQAGTNAPTYMGMGGGNDEGDEDDDDSDAEDIQIQADDAIVVVAKTEDEFASLEVHVYEQKTGNLFIHHDIPLPAFPLCLSHGDISPQGTAGNFCAVGTFNPGIEIWNLDVLNALEPACVLGGEDTTIADEIMRHNMMNTTGKKNKQQKLKFDRRPSLRVGSHTDAVMSLSWNKIHRQVIASGSADGTVKLWDVTQANTDQANASTFTHHKDKVQSVLWHPKEGTLLATGSYDRTVALIDARSHDSLKKVKIPADCEALAWDPFTTEYLTVASEDGSMICWDVRKFSTKTPLWSIVANEYGGVSDLCYNPNVPGMLATCSVDKTVTLWDTYNDTTTPTTGPPRACGNKDMSVGKLYTVNFYPSSPWLVGCAGNGKELAIWDMTRESSIQNRFASRIGVIPILEELEDTIEKKDEAFTAMMTPTSTPEPTKHIPTKEDISAKNRKKKKCSGSTKKSKAHKVRS